MDVLNSVRGRKQETGIKPSTKTQTTVDITCGIRAATNVLRKKLESLDQ
jgi:hypothetical protein